MKRRLKQTGELLTIKEINALVKGATGAGYLDSVSDPIFPVPKPTPSTVYHTVYRNGIEQNGLGDWVEKWSEKETFVEHVIINEDLSETLVTVAEQKAALFETFKTKKKDDVTAKRYSVETSGVALGPTSIATDERSQGKINGALNLVQLNPSTIIKFKSDSGWVSLDAANMTAIAAAVGTHVQDCFANEEALHTAIDAASNDNELDAIDINTGWPS